MNQTAASTTQQARSAGACPLDGGLTWTTFTPSNSVVDPVSTTGELLDYATDNQVAFDRKGNFYVLTNQHNSDNNTGFLFLNQFNLNGGTLTRTLNNKVVYGWRSDAANPPGVRRAVKPTLAVNSNLATFSDVNSNGQTVTQTDPSAGAVYVAYATIDDAPSGVSPWNPNTIRMTASFDGGANFITPVTVGIGGNSDLGQRLTAPRMTISQGNASGTVTGGQVTLVYDDFGSGSTASPPVDLLWVARISPNPVAGSLTVLSNNNVGTTFIRGAVGSTSPTSTPSNPFGIAPAPVLASDNTLGAYSEHQGRLYLAYADRYNVSGNPADNSDIQLLTSDDGGLTWSGPVQVNDDNAGTDGFSAADLNQTVTGRPQYQPQVAVDQTNGTLVVSYFDTRFDAAKARVATMIQASIDGGASFSKSTFTNAPLRVTDVASNSTKILGPIPDNESGGNNQTNKATTFAFGDYQGLAVYGGKVYPAWASNSNGGAVGNQLLQITVGRRRRSRRSRA
ncbi:MAG: sialidase family protein [Isosphaeraceae bacterium]